MREKQRQRERETHICGTALIIGKYQGKRSWNGYVSDPLPSACARSGVAHFISACSVVLLFTADDAGLMFIKDTVMLEMEQYGRPASHQLLAVKVAGALHLFTKEMKKRRK